MEKKVIKPLKQKLFNAVVKVLNDNNSDLTKKMEALVNKSIKRIVKRTEKQNQLAIKYN